MATEALGQPYPDRKQAHAGIQAAIMGFYERRYPELGRSRKANIDSTVARVVELYDGNVFPEMKVNWKTHADNRGHKDWPGCFRCHDGRHATKSGKILGGECTLCHTMPVRGPLQPLGVMSQGAPGAGGVMAPPGPLGEARADLLQPLPPGGTSRPATCTECHKIDPEAPMIEQGCDSRHRVPHEVTSMRACGDCHSPKGLHMKATHAETVCTFCHKPHQWRVTGWETCMQFMTTGRGTTPAPPAPPVMCSSTSHQTHFAGGIFRAQCLH